MIRAAALCLLATPVAAFQPPQGCKGRLTVQYRGCLVSNVWTCPQDAEGEQWVGLFTQAGLAQARKVDPDFQWLETFQLLRGERETMQVPAPDPESLSELFESGEDLYDFTVEIDPGERAVRYQGFDRLTGETVTIDGVTLLRTEYAYQAMTPDGDVLYSSAGRQFVSKAHRLFFLGESWAPDDDEVEDNSPVSFAFPGDPGFMASRPAYDCDALDTGFRP